MSKKLPRFPVAYITRSSAWSVLVFVQTVYAASLAPLPERFYPRAVSDTGVVVGETTRYDGDESAAAKWSTTEGLTYLAPLNYYSRYSAALAVSRDASVILGRDASGAFRWDSSGEIIDILGGSGFGVSDQSDNGHAVVGWHNGANNITEATLWTRSTGWTGLGALPGSRSALALDVSDNRVVVGGSTVGLISQAFRWTQSEGMEYIGLPNLTGEHSSATTVSADGAVVAGSFNRAGKSEAYRWTRETGLVGLGLLPVPTGAFPNETWGMSMTADGSTVVGATNHFPGGGFIWTESAGIRYFTDVLTTDYGLGDRVSDLYYSGMQAISPNGRYTISTNGYSGGWLFDRGSFMPVPEPSTYGLTAAALLIVAAVIKRHRAMRHAGKEYQSAGST